MPVRSWVLPGDTADVTTVARIKDDLRAWRLGRCLFVGDAGMYSAGNLAELSRGSSTPNWRGWSSARTTIRRRRAR
jgi:transposase